MNESPAPNRLATTCEVAWPFALLAVRSSMLVLLAMTTTSVQAQVIFRGHTSRAHVSKPTQLDWSFALSNQSIPESKFPDNWFPEAYDSLDQQYELYVPERYDGAKSWPLLLFVSPGNEPTGGVQWGAACRKLGILFACPRQAGNSVSVPQRTRIILDVLGDIRSKYNIDPDQTCIGGFSGGGRIACQIAFALPEYFGGVIPVCAGGDLRQEPWLRQRVIDRLSVAQLTGTSDFNRGEVERMHQTKLTAVGVRCKTWVAPRTGHAIPKSSLFTSAWNWIAADLPRRRQLSQQWPASQMGTALTREEWSEKLLQEAKSRLDRPETLHSGLMQLKGLRVRWSGLDTAEKALQILADFDERSERPWEAEELRQQRVFLVAQARGIDAYASGPLPRQYQSQKQVMLDRAIYLWEQVAAISGSEAESPDSAAFVREARTRLIRLRAIRK